MVTLTASSTSSKVGKSATFSGSVTPNEAGDVIDLEQLGADGHFHTVQSASVDGGSAYAVALTFGSPGTQTFRVMAPGEQHERQRQPPRRRDQGGAAARGNTPDALRRLQRQASHPSRAANDQPNGRHGHRGRANDVHLHALDRDATQSRFRQASDRVDRADRGRDLQRHRLGPGILSHTFEVCTTPLPGPVTTLAAIQALPNSCSGTTAPPNPNVLAPGASATMTIHFTSPGTYEYLSTVAGRQPAMRSPE